MTDLFTDFMNKDAPAILLFLLFACAFAGIKAESNKHLAALSGVVVTMFCAALLSNFNIIPTDAPTYDMVWKYFIPFSIPLLLFRANLTKIKQEAGPMLKVYIAGVVGTIVGSVVSFFVVFIGPETWKVISMFCASYIGGSVNYVSVSQILQLQEKSLFLSGTAADNLTMALYFSVMGLMAASTKLLHYFSPTKAALTTSFVEEDKSVKFELVMESSFLALLITIGFYCFALFLKTLFHLPGIEILTITLLTLAFANLFPKTAQKMYDTEIIGRVLMMVFFAVIGASCDLALVIRTAPLMFALTAIIIAFQFVFALIGAKLFKVGLPETLIACNANAGGPATAVAMASSLGMKHLVIPGILCGTLGYAIGTFVGIGLAQALQKIST